MRFLAALILTCALAGVGRAHIAKDSFGNVLSDTNPALNAYIGFAGGLYDQDTGLVLFGYRDYLPDIGRWTAKDPILLAGGDLDLYAYCGQDPVNRRDPSGLAGDLVLYAGFGELIASGTVLGAGAVIVAGATVGIGAYTIASSSTAVARATASVGTGVDALVDWYYGANTLNLPATMGACAAGGTLAAQQAVSKAVNSNLPHAIARGIERGVFSSADEAGAVLRSLTEQITRSGTFPAGTLDDTARPGRFLVPVGNNGMAVYQLAKNGTAILKTVLIGR